MKFKMTEKVGDCEVTKDFEGEVEELLAIYREVFTGQQAVKEHKVVKGSGFNLEAALKCQPHKEMNNES